MTLRTLLSACAAMARSLSLICAISWLLASVALAQHDEVALVLVYDTSGSMRDAVRAVAGRGAPKYTIGNRALLAVIDRLQKFSTKSDQALTAGLVVFDDRSAREAVRLGKIDCGELRHWAKSFISPDGPTPLGPALEVASQALLARGNAQRHILVITDGENTAGPDPASVIRASHAKNEGIAFHFVAFDVNAKALGPIKELGATVVSAADEKELNNQLEFILAEKILLEK